MLPQPIAIPKLDDFRHVDTLPPGPIYPGIYALMRDETLVYIGQSWSVPERLKTHAREKKHNFTHALYFACPTVPERVRIEAILILMFSPPDNRALSLTKGASGQWVEVGFRRWGKSRTGKKKS